MKHNNKLKDLGETKLIKIIEEFILKKTNQRLIRDDAFFFSLLDNIDIKGIKSPSLIFNSDMLVSSTDVPHQMNFYQIGRKSILMNMSDLIVKGVNPLGLFISLGLPSSMKLSEFEELINGIIDYNNKFGIKYIGGDLNETQEIIINPSLFGIIESNKIIHRKGMNINDLLVINGRFGLTGVGFDILLNKGGSNDNYKKYSRAINSVLEPVDLGIEGLILSKYDLATASIDSSDGLAKSLKELVISNPEVGIELDFNSDMIDDSAIQYSKEYNIPLEDLVLDAGEEFIHIFSMKPKNYDIAQEMVQSKGGKLLKIGKVISDPNLYMVKDDEKIIISKEGYEHFGNNS